MVQGIEHREALLTGARSDYSTKEFALDTATTDEEWIVRGDNLTAWTNGSLSGITVKLNHKNAPAIHLSAFNPLVVADYWKLFITWTAQSGRTLRLLAGRQAYGQAFQPSYQAQGRTGPGSVYTIRSDKDTHFTGGINQNAKEDENLTGLPCNKIRIVGIALQSDQNLRYRAIFWKTDGFDDTDLDSDKFCGEIEVDLVTYGFRIGAANQYYLDVRLTAGIDYEDEDVSQELHVSLQNLSATAKNSGATGEIAIEVYYEMR